MNTKLKYIVGMILGALFTIPLASSALSVFTVPQGGTASSSLTGILKGNGKNAIQTATPGTDYVVPGTLASYLSLSSWYATTTDGLDEGLLNKYFSDSLVDTWFSVQPLGMFWSTTSADHWYTLQNKASTTLLGDANTWSAYQDFSAGLTASDVNTNSLTSHDYTNTFFEFTNTGASLNVPSTSNYLTLKNSTDAGQVNLRMENLTGAHDIYFPDQGGTFAMLSDLTTASSTLYGDSGTFSGLNQFAKLTFTNATGTNATTSSFAVSNLSAGLVKAVAGGSLVNATAGVDYQAPGSYITLSSLSALAPIVYNSGTGAFSWTGLATTSQPASSNLLVSNGGAGVYGVATGTVSASLPISVTAGRSVIGGSLAVSIANAVDDGSTKGAASFTANDFNATAGNISIDYTNGTAASAGAKGFLTSADFSTFAGKENALTFSYPLSRSVNAISLAFGTTTANTWGTTQTFTAAPVFSSLTGLLKGNGASAVSVASLGTDYVNGSGVNGNCVAWGASNALTDAGAPCGSGTGGGASQWATSTLFANMIHTAGAHGLGIGTTTPIGVLSMASSSAVTQWWNHTGASANSRLGYISFANGVFDFGTSSDAGATTSRLTLSQGTSTFNGNALTVGTGSYPSSLVQGVGTSTMWGGINLSNGGCFAVSGVCMGTMALSGSIGQVEYFSGVNTAVGTSSLYIATSQNVGIGTTSPYAKLSVQGTAGLTDAFAVASSTLATMFNVTANGRVGIGSSTPWGTLSIIDSISGSYFPGVITATSTADLPYFGWTASTSEYAGSAVRILAGNPSAYMSSADSLDQLLLNGRINTGDWKQLECASDFNSKTAQITGDITGSVMSTTLGKPCGDFSYIEDANGVADFVVTTGSGYIRLRPGATGATVVAGDGFGLAGTTAFLRHATNTPVYLATVRPGAVQNASTSIYMLGFSAATGVSANYATDAQDGCFFVASSTKANWQAVCRSTTATIVDTGVASSTVTTGDSAWRQFRIDMIGGPTPYAVFRIKQSASASWGPPVATIATTMPTAVSLNPITSVGKVSAGLSPELHVNRIRVWYNDPLWY